MLNWWSLAPEVKAAALKINTPEFTSADEKMIVTFFESGEVLL